MARRFAGAQQLPIPGLAEQIATPANAFAFAPAFRSGASGVLKGIGKRAIPIAGVGTILALLDAAGEFTDTDDPISRNASEAGGQITGNLLGALLGGGLGFAVGGPAGAVIGGGLGGAALGAPGKGIGAGIYDQVTGYSAGERARQKEIEDARTKMLINNEAMQLKAAQERQAAELALSIQNKYNFANTANQQLLNQQAAANLQDIAMQQYLFS